MSEDRLDRLEALAEKMLEGIVQLNYRTDSNAKSIQALSLEWAEDRKQWEKDRQEWEKDRKGIYQLLGRLTRSMSDFYEVQSDFYNRFDQIEARHTEIMKYLKSLHQKEEKEN